MSMVIGKEARQELERIAKRSKVSQARLRVQQLLDRCTDAPEVGSAEPVAFFTKTGRFAFSDSGCDPGPHDDGTEWMPLYARAPEVGLPDVNWRAVASLMRWAGKQVLPEPRIAAQLLSEADALEHWLESAGQKEGGE